MIEILPKEQLLLCRSGTQEDVFFSTFWVRKTTRCFHEIVITVIRVSQGFKSCKFHTREAAMVFSAALLSRLARKLASLQPCKKVLHQKFLFGFVIFISLSKKILANNNEFTNLAWKYAWIQTRYFSPIFWSLICHATRYTFSYRFQQTLENYLKPIPLRKRIHVCQKIWCRKIEGN